MVIAVFYGGKSCEHDVSVVTGVQTISALKGHTILPIYIKRDGSWHLVFNYGDFSAYKKGAPFSGAHRRLGKREAKN